MIDCILRALFWLRFWHWDTLTFQRGYRQAQEDLKRDDVSDLMAAWHRCADGDDYDSGYWRALMDHQRDETPLAEDEM